MSVVVIVVAAALVVVDRGQSSCMESGRMRRLVLRVIRVYLVQVYCTLHDTTMFVWMKTGNSIISRGILHRHTESIKKRIVSAVQSE